MRARHPTPNPTRPSPLGIREGYGLNLTRMGWGMGWGGGHMGYIRVYGVYKGNICQVVMRICHEDATHEYTV